MIIPRKPTTVSSHQRNHAAELRPVVTLGVLLATTASSLAANPGELDLSFTPAASELPAYPNLKVVGSDVFLYSFTNFYRYRDNGRRDTGWTSSVPVRASSSLMFTRGSSLGRLASFIAMSQPFSPDHTVVWSGAAGLVLVGNNLGKSQLRRWEPSGRCDDRFQCNFNNAKVETMSLLPDGGILVSRLLRTLPPPGGARRLVRIGPDSDMKLLDPRIVGGISRSV